VLTLPLWVTLPSGLVRAATLRVTGLKRYSAPDHTRLVFELDAPMNSPRTRALGDSVVALEIPGAEYRSVETPISVQDGLVARLVFQNLAGSLGVRVELQRPADFSAFTLAPNAGGAQHRIVLDLRKRLNAAEREQAERETEAARRSGDVIVAVDAGHGGNDPGCNGNGVLECEVALDVARGTRDAIAKKPGMRAVLTRDGNYFVPLGKRQEIARKYDARVFVSIHLNSGPSPAAHGSEVFFLSLKGAADKAARELVDRENAADQVGGVAPDERATALVDILWNMKQNEMMRQSERLGEIVLDRLGSIPGNEVRGLKQGPLAVLKSITCASILVELGFVTNSRDARLLQDPGVRRRFAAYIADGVADFVGEEG